MYPKIKKYFIYKLAKNAENAIHFVLMTKTW